MKFNLVGRTIDFAKLFSKNAISAVVAGITGAAVAASKVDNAVRGTANAVRQTKNSKAYREVVSMKKSTVVALFVALATVAGVLGALYVYVLRREKELDEYEQLLFSENFNDDLPLSEDELDEDEDEDEDDSES